jgi:protocatechuate 3,4-dioxygenase beta subunit
MNSRKTVFITAALLVVAAIVYSLFQIRGDSPGHVGSEPASSTTEQPGRENRTQLRVVVTDYDGNPIEGAVVEVAEQTGETGAEGVWTSRDLEPGDVTVAASSEGYIATGPLAARREVHVAGGAHLDVPLTLRQPGAIEGRITADGGPVRARLSLIYAGDEFAVDGAGESGPDGRFRLDGVPPGRLRVMVETEEAFATTESREIALEDGETVAGVELDLSQAGSVAGKVVDSDGNPIADAEVVARGERSPRARRTMTTSRGGFRIDRFPSGSARLRIRADGYSEQVVEDVAVSPGEVSVVEVTLERGSGVWGKVTTPDGKPARRAFVMLLSGEEEAAIVRTRRDGSYRLDVRPEPGARVLAVSPARAKSQPAAARPGARVDLTLGGGGIVRGRVVDSDGEPVTDFEVGVESMEVEEPVPYRARANGQRDYVSSDGTFEFGLLRPGRYWLRANASGHAPGAAGPVVVTADHKSDEVIIELTSGGTLAGTVTDDKGRPLGGARVMVFDPMSPFRTARTRTGADGGYQLEGVQPGRRSIRVSKRGYLSSVASGITVPAGGEATRNVQLGRKKKGEKFSFHGIGAVLRKSEDGAIEIRNTMEGKPAAVFGLQKGDRIVAVDGQSTSEMRLGNVVELIRGEEGAAVQLTLQRRGEGRLVVEVERGRVVVK